MSWPPGSAGRCLGFLAVPVTVCGVKLAQWARENGVNEDTAYRWFHAGVLPVPARQLPTGTILVEVAPVEAGGAATVALYARVSSADQRADLDQPAGPAGLLGVRAGPGRVEDVGGGRLRAERPVTPRYPSMALLADPAVQTIVVEHRERLASFGVEYIEAALAAQGRHLTVVDDTEIDDDLVHDVTEVLTSLCARL